MEDSIFKPKHRTGMKCEKCESRLGKLGEGETLEEIKGKKLSPDSIFRPMAGKEKAVAHKTYMSRLPTEDEAFEIISDDPNTAWIEEIPKGKKYCVGGFEEVKDGPEWLNARELIKWAQEMKQSEDQEEGDEEENGF
jgi:hypothetical protein